MCGRYTLTTNQDTLQARFSCDMGEILFTPRYNVAPTQRVLTVLRDGAQTHARMMRWGMVPSWAKDTKIGNRMINARAETVVENKVFRQVFSKQRCLVIADSFYEWRKNNRVSIPMRIMLKSGAPFAFAGLWSTWRSGYDSEDTVYSCAIITTIANRLIEPIIQDRYVSIISV